MTVRSILDAKGRDVVTMASTETLDAAIKTLGQYRIGAVVVSDGGGRIAGILSERDVVRLLASKGASALNLPISAAMTAKVQTCTESSTVHGVMEQMTAGRFRHLPVEEGGKLVGIISIGDVVKRRIQEVEREAEDMKAYISAV